MRGAQAQAAHFAWQTSVSVAAVVGVKSSGAVVLTVPGAITISVAVAVAGSGVSVVQVSGLWSGRGRRL